MVEVMVHAFAVATMVLAGTAYVLSQDTAVATVKVKAKNG